MTSSFPGEGKPSPRTPLPGALRADKTSLDTIRRVGMNCTSPLWKQTDWRGYTAPVKISNEYAWVPNGMPQPMLLPQYVPLPADRAQLSINGDTALQVKFETVGGLAPPLTMTWTVTVASPFHTDLVSITGPTITVSITVVKDKSPQGRLIVSSDGVRVVRSFYSDVRSRWVTWALALASPTSGDGVIRMYEDGAPVMLFGGGAARANLTVNAVWPAFTTWTFGNFTDVKRSVGRLVDARVIPGESYSDEKAAQTVAGIADCAGTVSSPPPPSLSLPSVGDSCVKFAHTLNMTNGDIQDTADGSSWKCSVVTTGGGWMCQPGVLEAIGPPFTLHVIARALPSAKAITGASPLVTLTNALAPWARATMYGIWMQPQGMADAVTFVAGIPGAVRAYDVWTPGKWIALTVVASATRVAIIVNGVIVAAAPMSDPMPGMNLSAVYVASAPDPSYPCGFPAEVAFVGLATDAMDDNTAVNMNKGSKFQAGMGCGAGTPPPAAQMPPLPLQPPPSPPFPPLFSLLPASCGATGPAHRWLPRNVRGRDWMDEPKAGVAPWDLTLADGSVPDASVAPPTLATASGAVSGRHILTTPFTLYAQLQPNASSTIFTVSGDDGTSLQLSLDSGLNIAIDVVGINGIGTHTFLFNNSATWKTFQQDPRGAVGMAIIVKNSGLSLSLQVYVNTTTSSTSFPSNANPIISSSLYNSFNSSVWRSITLGKMGATFTDVALYTTAFSMGTSGVCFYNSSSPSPPPQVAPITVPTYLPGALLDPPLHRWSAAAQPGAWGLADLLVDTGTASSAHAAAPTMRLLQAT